MFEDPQLELQQLSQNITIERIMSMSVEEYKELFISVGKDWTWAERLVIPEEELENIISDSNMEIYLMNVDGELAGFVELDRRNDNDIEISYLGLMPDFIGKGLGKYILHWAIQKAWSYMPSRLWLHTCELDSPNAMALYQKVGFKIYKVCPEDQYLPEIYND